MKSLVFAIISFYIFGFAEDVFTHWVMPTNYPEVKYSFILWQQPVMNFVKVLLILLHHSLNSECSQPSHFISHFMESHLNQNFPNKMLYLESLVNTGNFLVRIHLGWLLTGAFVKLFWYFFWGGGNASDLIQANSSPAYM